MTANLLTAVRAKRSDIALAEDLGRKIDRLIREFLFANDVDINSLRGLRFRQQFASDLRDRAACGARIAEVEARIAELPEHLNAKTREEIAMWEGQLQLAERGADDRQIKGIKAKIAGLMQSGEAVAA